MTKKRSLFIFSIELLCFYFVCCDPFVQSGRYYQHLEILNKGSDTINVFFDGKFMVTLEPDEKISGDVIAWPPRLQIIVPDRDESLSEQVGFHYWSSPLDSNSSKPYVFKMEGKMKDSIVYYREFTVTTRNFDSLKFMKQIIMQ